jgi:ribosomal protein S18 acetylase RimI-like enzyme
MNTHTLPSTTTASSNALSSPTTTSAPREKPARSERTLAERKLLLLKRSGLFGTNTKGATVTRAVTFEDLRAAYRLVHDVYLGTGYIRPEPSGLRLRIFETTSETATFVAKVDGRVVGVLSVVGDSADFGLPSDSAFKSELDVLRATGARLCELTNQAVADEFRQSAVPTELMRCAVAHSMKAGYAEGIATVSPSHNGFYELMGFRQLGAERSYSQKLHDPVVALSMNLDQYRQPATNLGAAEQFVHNFAAEGNPFQARVLGWAREARRHFLDADMLQQLFVKERNFLGECTLTQLRVIQRRWGQELFSAVTDDCYFPLDARFSESSTPWAAAEHCARGLVGHSAAPFGAPSDGFPFGVTGNLPRVRDVLRHYLSKAIVGVVCHEERTCDSEIESNPAPRRLRPGYAVSTH